MAGIAGTIKVYVEKPARWPLPVAMQDVFREAVARITEEMARHNYALNPPADLYPIFSPHIDSEEQLQGAIFDWLQAEEKRLKLPAGWNRRLGVEEFSDIILIYQDDDTP